MRSMLLTLFILSLFYLSGCGLVKGSSNKTIDNAIKATNASYPQENFLEEWVEGEIEDVTGLDVDLSPASPEEQDKVVEGQ